jgi:hypothetical protein
VQNCITKMLDDFQIVFFDDSLAFWCTISQ